MTEPQIAMSIFAFLIGRGLFYVLWEIDAQDRAASLRAKLLLRMSNS